MKKKYKNVIIFSLFFVLVVFIISLNTEQIFAQSQELEIEYEEIGGLKPETVDFPITSYVKYIFNYMIIGIGGTALWYLLEGGVRFLTSTGKPENLKAARDQILAAFLGIIILLSACIILTYISPQLVIFRLPELEIFAPPEVEEPTPSAPPVYKNFLWRITEIAVSVKDAVGNTEDGIEATAQDIKSLISSCDCKYTQPACLCPDYTESSGCSFLYCYSEEISQPCPDSLEIKEEQQDIIASLSEILYYRNRAIEEREDFLIGIENLEKQISYYEEKIEKEEDYLDTIEGEYARDEQEKFIEDLKNKKTALEDLKARYQDLEGELENLIERIEEIAPPIDRLAKLPDGIPEDEIPGCLANVKEFCAGSCEGGCHDKEKCAPVECNEGNPCPVDEIDEETNNVSGFSDNIKDICDKIIEMVKNIVNP